MSANLKRQPHKPLPEISLHRNSFHLARRIFHMLSGTAIVVMGSLFFREKRDLVGALLLATLLDLAIEGARLNYLPLNRWFRRVMGPLMRRGEQHRVSGAAYYLLGCLISAVIFPREIAMLAILYLAFGDPIASLCGVGFGKNNLPRELEVSHKSIEGSIGCFVVCFFS